MDTFTESTAQPIFILLKIDFKGQISLSPPLSHSCGERITREITNAMRMSGVLYKQPPAPANKFIATDEDCTVLCLNDKAAGVMSVTDWRKGVQALHAKLKTLKLLRWSVFGYWDEGEGTYKTLWPEGSTESLAEVLDLINKWCEEAKQSTPPQPPLAP